MAPTTAYAVVILGARLTRDGEPTPAYRRRLDEAVVAWKEGGAVCICIAGGARWWGRCEAHAGRRYVLSRGVPEGLVCIEPWSVTTRGNARGAACLLGDVPIRLVTDAYHMWRSRRCFRRWFEEVSARPVPKGWTTRSLLREVAAIGWEIARPMGTAVRSGTKTWTARPALLAEQALCHGVRRVVFQVEQRVPASIERDGHDEEARHWVLLSGGAVFGTARARPLTNGEVKIERVAVLARYRGEGGGRVLMQAVHATLSGEGVPRAKLHAQEDVVGFYESLGYEVEGEVFYEADIPHRVMWITFPE